MTETEKENWDYYKTSIDGCTDCGKLFCNDDDENGECTFQHDHDNTESWGNEETGELLCKDCAKARGII
ncbi:hypothetical protein [endosymbiont GvMRE of Glomus versiforme]|uniref:hypothetical protein n=1 Tax=endosymbiont GvMRE of Glomus versiforme TaxID=2039283 RepID=UPI000EBCD4A8|nr:hypothetical protein [endosymbiont GvMRE of Glomus versiforme]RHZ37412.1 hypothetical protein GvMRE_I1g427 [endosymbiont GvMRE of Glomus versiforme]